MIYKADLTHGSLKLPESRIIADLLLKDIPPEGWKLAIHQKNVLQAKSPKTADNLCRLIRGRLSLMGPDLWKLVRDGKGATANHAIFAAALKHSRLLCDFMGLVVAEQFKLFAQTLPTSLWGHYIEGCRERDPAMSAWSPSTIHRQRSSAYQTLAQVGYIDSIRQCRLQAVHIAEPVLQYLRSQRETEVLRSISVGP